MIASPEQHRLVLQAAPTGIVILDPEGGVLLANPAAAALLRIASDDMSGRQLTLPSALDEERLITPDGRVIEMRTAAITWEGSPALVATLHDITDALRVQKLEAEVKQDVEIIRRLRELDRARNQLVEMATHELRTPMTPMRSAVQMLLSESLGPLNAQQRTVVEMMSRNVERLSRFSTDMLSLSRLDAGGQTLKKAPVNLSVIARGAVELFEQRYAEAGVRLRLSAGGPLLAWGDADALSQVMVNLLENALVHAEPAEVKVSARGVDDVWVELVVRDDGSGIARSDLPAIFERFRQLKRRRGPGYQGSGLGLALCRELTERMEGQIVVESSLGVGTRFRVRLRRVGLLPDEDSEDPNSMVLERPSKGSRKQQMREILLRSKRNREKKGSGDE